MRIEKNVKVIISLFMPNEFPPIINWTSSFFNLRVVRCYFSFLFEF